MKKYAWSKFSESFFKKNQGYCRKRTSNIDANCNMKELSKKNQDDDAVCKFYGHLTGTFFSISPDQKLNHE